MTAMKIKWTKEHTGRYTAEFLGEQYVAQKSEQANTWLLLVVSEDADTGYDWCNSFNTFAALKNTCKENIE